MARGFESKQVESQQEEAARGRVTPGPEVSPAERAYIVEGRGPEPSHSLTNVPWGLILRSRNVWLLCLMYFVQTYGFYFYLTWMPTYLERVRG